MAFRIGDKVIHYAFGLGEIAQIEEKVINGHLTKCYVIQLTDMTIWVPVDDSEQKSLRRPTPPEEFIKTLPILSSQNDQLVEDRVERKKQLTDQLKDGQLASSCRVVRDLSHYRSNSKLNDQEKSIFDRAVNSLLAEWSFTMGVSPYQAHQTMDTMLGR